MARTALDLAAAERFQVDGLRLGVLQQTDGRLPGQHDLVTVGPPAEG
ncbi:hypothetical protein [Streptomyces sp. cmx-4-9]